MQWDTVQKNTHEKYFMENKNKNKTVQQKQFAFLTTQALSPNNFKY